ncbi:hypothetical protein GVAV_002768 [Gurleya vavrai]
MSFYYIKSQRIADLLMYMGYIYTCHSINNSIVRWRCQIRQCTGSVCIKNNNFFNSSSHNHVADEIKARTLVVKNDLKNKSLNSIFKINDVIIETISKKNDEVVEKLPN